MSDDHRPHAWRLLVETHAVLYARVAEELRAELGLPMTWYDVLQHLEEVPGQALRMRELSDAVVISKSGLTAVVDRMEGAGLVERRVPPGDRRSIEVALTDAGRKRFEHADAVHRRGIGEHFVARLDKDDGERLAAILEKLRA